MRMRRAHCIALAAIFVYAIFIRAWNIGEPWGRHLLGMNGAWHSIIARNFLHYGLVALKGAPVLNASAGTASDWTVYLHHPPLLDWLIALSFSIFGVHEWSARLVVLIAALGSIERVFTLARRLFSDRAAVGAAFFLATLPVSAIYGMHVDFQGSVVLYFALGAFCAYERFVRTGAQSYWFQLAGWTTLCCLTDWPGFYIPILLLIHRVALKNKQPLRWWVFLFGYCVFLLVLFFLYCLWVKGDLGFLFHQFFRRSCSFRDDSGRAFGFADWIRAIGHYLWTLYTLPVLVAFAIWTGQRVHDSIRRVADESQTHVWILIGFGVMHLVIPLQAAYQHDCLVLYLSPGLSMCAALVCQRLTRLGSIIHLSRSARRFLYGTGVACLVVGFSFQSIRYPSGMRSRADIAYGYTSRELGEMVRAHSQPGEGAIIAGEETCTPAVWFYADRPLNSFIWSIDSFREVLERGRFWGPECFEVQTDVPVTLFVMPKRFVSRYEELIAYVRSRCPERETRDFLLFEIATPLAFSGEPVLRINQAQRGTSEQ